MANAPEGVISLVADLRKLDQVEAAIKDMDIVFHVATAAPTGENALNIQLMQSVNVTGTENVIQACKSCGVKALIYTSSASVVFEGKPLKHVDEDCPYASKPMDYYTRTKIDGEKLILAANSKSLQTVALRPSGIFGEGDMVFVPTLVRNARKGKMKYIIGSGENLMDFTYAGNVALAHLLAADALTSCDTSTRDRVAGKAYFITNDEPVPFWNFMGDTCAELGYPRPARHLPFFLIIFIAAIFEYVIRPLVKPIMGNLQTDFTVNRILIATTHRSFSCNRAKKDFGYRPAIKLHDALKKSITAFEHLSYDNWQKELTGATKKK
eukprot:CAMPEP_0175051864 /NCGR_PEP_ID=MMETSP0052_2-20121109/8043_1 /TAXON_ID=51329 ORGANISM="Polytomella parva, Strain SAG 63-3" /NCGR_SAMPLE_ID=MMETSP0052_2 /ASSEMBLY_ACC=CAM_ASM_000194 /LENGTH=323 /DNA_ID=CAMNT_0016316209 /DNA_START=206 /DNA_END=1177 /DNA_ORIENTATION=-